MAADQRVTLRELFRLFFIIGATGFGGGMAIISLMERYCVREKRLLPQQEFMHGMAFSQLLGVFSLNTATFVGCRLRGVAGGITTAVAFILPSFLIISLLSWCYFRFHELPGLSSAFLGANPVVIGLIVVAAIGMGRRNVRGWNGWLLALSAFAASTLLDASYPLILALAGTWAIVRSMLLEQR